MFILQNKTNPIIMLKEFLLVICVALPMFATAQFPKFGIVNTQEVLDAMPDLKK